MNDHDAMTAIKTDLLVQAEKFAEDAATIFRTNEWMEIDLTGHHMVVPAKEVLLDRVRDMLAKLPPLQPGENMTRLEKSRILIEVFRTNDDNRPAWHGRLAVIALAAWTVQATVEPEA
jgi:Flp pilus assembly CpaF family ATPase